MARAALRVVRARKPNVCSVGDESIAIGDSYAVVESFRRRTAFCLKHQPTPEQASKMAPQSRADRASDVAGQLTDAASELNAIAEEVRGLLVEDDDGNVTVSDPDALAELQKRVEAVGWDWSEVESLAEEMRTWADNLDGGNLGQTQKYSDVDDCASTLEELDEPDAAPTWLGSEPDSLSSFANECEERAEELESVASELEGVDFPTAF